MAVTLGGTSLATLHQLPEFGPFVNEPIITSVYGVRGTVQITDERHGREIRIACTYSGYSTVALLETALATLDGYIPAKADKTLVVTVGASTLTYYHCTLNAVERLPNPANGTAAPYYDGSGVNGWRQELMLHIWQSDTTQ